MKKGGTVRNQIAKLSCTIDAESSNAIVEVGG